MVGGLVAENVAKWNAIRGSLHVLQRCLRGLPLLQRDLLTCVMHRGMHRRKRAEPCDSSR